jgi:hypothetical protein
VPTTSGVRTRAIRAAADRAGNEDVSAADRQRRRTSTATTIAETDSVACAAGSTARLRRRATSALAQRVLEYRHHEPPTSE